MSKRKTLKIIGYTLLALIIISVGAIAYEYKKLQPQNHFKNVPVLSASGNKTENNTNTQQTQTQNSAFNILLLGSDERKGQNVGHSDSMIIVHVDLNKKQYSAMSIPRDTRVHLDGYGYTKLTSVQYITQATEGSQKGVEAAAKAISDLTGLPINYYVETNYTGLQSLTDAVGGIHMNVPFDVKLTHPWYPENRNKVIQKGTQFLDGKMVTEVVHERYSLQNGEFGRQQLQKEALVGIANAALDPANITNLPKFIQTIPQFLIASNMTTSDMLSLGLAVKDSNPTSNLQYYQLSGEGKTMYDDILKNNNYQLVINEDQMKQLVAAHFQ